MTPERIAEAATLLVSARRGHGLLPNLPAALQLESVADAHAIQDAVTAGLGLPVGAFKANAPAGEPPTRGIIYAPTIHASPARLPAATVPLCGVEGEIAFRFTRDLSPRAADYTRDEVTGAVEALAAIEVVDSRYQNLQDRSALEKLADCIANGAFVPAAPRPDWRRLDLPNLHVTLAVNGTEALRQHGGHPTGDPLGVAVALVNMMRAGPGVRTGQYVTCGSCTGLRFLKPGDRCTVTFEGLGTAEVTFTT